MRVQVRVATRIAEDRTLTLQLPPSVPIGDVELTLTIDDHTDRPLTIPPLPAQRGERSGLVREIRPQRTE